MSQEIGVQRYNTYEDTSEYLPIYKINQVNKKLLWEKGVKKLYVSTTMARDTSSEDGKKPDSIITSLTLSSCNMELKK